MAAVGIAAGAGAAPWGWGWAGPRASLSRRDFMEAAALFDGLSLVSGARVGFWSIGAGGRKTRPLDPRRKVERQPHVTSRTASAKIFAIRSGRRMA